MKPFSKAAVLMTGGALLLGTGLALSSVGSVSGASNVQPDKSTSCVSSKPCIYAINGGKGPGVRGDQTSATLGALNSGGLIGVGNGANGVYGYSASRNGGFFQNDASSYITLYADGGSDTEYLFEAQSYASGGGYAYIDYLGDAYFTGEVDALGGYTTVIRSHGATIGAFSSESTRATLEDTGTARLMNGEAAVRFDPALAGAVDMRQGYQVFLTPDGETRGWLYVAAKYEGGFIVREAEHGRSSISFDYRVVAHPIGSTTARLPAVTIKKMSPIPGHIPE
jgi:hypothetical protein